jgi:integrase
MGKNANGEGSIYKWFKNGQPAGYKGAISYEDDDGKTKRYVAYGRTRKVVKDKLDKARERLTAGAPVKDERPRSATGWRTGGQPFSRRRTARSPPRTCKPICRGVTGGCTIRGVGVGQAAAV